LPVHIELDARGVATLTVDHRARLNVLTTDLMGALITAATEIGSHSALRVVLLRGAGERAFIGGADINEMAALDRASARSFITLVHETCAVFRALPVPVLARIHGYVLGAGLEVAASCDLRLTAADARFGMPEVLIGIPSVVEAALLPRLIGWGRARRLLLTGETINADQALAWGLVDEVVAPDAMDAAVDRTLQAILRAGPQAIRLQKALIQDWEGLPLGDAIARGIDRFAAAWETDEPRRMMTDFLERRRRGGAS
jgi:enoyl-CoA hydratase